MNPNQALAPEYHSFKRGPAVDNTADHPSLRALNEASSTEGFRDVIGHSSPPTALDTLLEQPHPFAFELLVACGDAGRGSSSIT